LHFNQILDSYKVELPHKCIITVQIVNSKELKLVKRN